MIRRRSAYRVLWFGAGLALLAAMPAAAAAAPPQEVSAEEQVRP